jgi:hypothetical protein
MVGEPHHPRVAIAAVDTGDATARIVEQPAVGRIEAEAAVVALDG